MPILALLGGLMALVAIRRASSPITSSGAPSAATGLHGTPDYGYYGWSYGYPGFGYHFGGYPYLYDPMSYKWYVSP
jgi:hypothetical protein